MSRAGRLGGWVALPKGPTIPLTSSLMEQGAASAHGRRHLQGQLGAAFPKTPLFMMGREGVS